MYPGFIKDIFSADQVALDHESFLFQPQISESSPSLPLLPPLFLAAAASVVELIVVLF